MCKCNFKPGTRVEYTGLAHKGKLGVVVEVGTSRSDSVYVRFDDESGVRLIHISNLKVSDQPKVTVNPSPTQGVLNVSMDYAGTASDPDKARIGKFILWDPASPLVPEVVYGTQREAEDVAVVMANRHGGVVYIAKLVGARRLPKSKVEAL